MRNRTHRGTYIEVSALAPVLPPQRYWATHSSTRSCCYTLLTILRTMLRMCATM